MYAIMQCLLVVSSIHDGTTTTRLMFPILYVGYLDLNSISNAQYCMGNMQCSVV